MKLFSLGGPIINLEQYSYKLFLGSSKVKEHALLDLSCQGLQFNDSNY